MVIVTADAASTTTSGDVADGSDDLDLGDIFGNGTTTGSSTGVTSNGTTGTTTGSVSTGTTTVVTNGDLEVSLSPTTPAATSVPATASAVPYMAVDFTAGNADTTISNVVLKREGFGTRDDLYRVWFELDGVRVSERASFLSDDTATVTFSPALVIKAGSTQTLKVVAEQKSGTNVINRVSIVSASSVTF